MQTDIGKNVILVHRKGVGATEITTSFVVAHGTMMNASFGIDRRTTLFFPWGVGHFGWYEKDVGCPLHEIMRNERSGSRQGLTLPSRLESTATPGKGGGVNSPITMKSARPTSNWRRSMVYCLCCSVKPGEETRAMAEAKGYVELK